MKKRFFLLLSLAALVTGLVPSGAFAKAAQTELVISAAASLQDSLLAIQPLYEKDHPGVKLSFNFGASGTLQKQIEQGAPADVFISAGAKQMKALVDEKLIDPADQKTLLSNDLVLVMPADSKIKLAKMSTTELTKSDFKHIAIGIPETVPAGMYAQETLKYLNIYDKLTPKLVQAKDVRQVLTYVETGNADAGFVYRTDAMTSNKVKVVLTIGQRAYEPIVYPAGVISGGKHEKEAADFYQYLQGDAAMSVFKKYGFKLPASA